MTRRRGVKAQGGAGVIPTSHCSPCHEIKKIKGFLVWALSTACPHPLIKQCNHIHKYWQLPGLFFPACACQSSDLWGPLLLWVGSKMQLPAWNTLSWAVPGPAQLLRPIWNGIGAHLKGGRGTERSLLIVLSQSPCWDLCTEPLHDNPVGLFLLLEVWRTEPQQDSQWNLGESKTSTLHIPQYLISQQQLAPAPSSALCPRSFNQQKYLMVPTWF